MIRPRSPPSRRYRHRHATPQGNLRSWEYNVKWIMLVVFFVSLLSFRSFDPILPSSQQKNQLLRSSFTGLHDNNNHNDIDLDLIPGRNGLELGFVVMGDYGTGLDGQKRVANQLGRFLSDIQPRPSFVLSTGDQIYDHG